MLSIIGTGNHVSKRGAGLRASRLHLVYHYVWVFCIPTDRHAFYGSNGGGNALCMSWWISEPRSASRTCIRIVLALARSSFIQVAKQV